MKPIHLLGAAALAAVLAACGTPEVTTVPDAEADISMPSTAAGTPAETASAAPQTAKVGDTITLTGDDPGLKVAVKLNKVLDPAEPADEFFKPKDGERYYAVELIVKNVGTAVYQDSPSNGAVIVDAEGQQYNPTIVDVKGGVAFSSVTVTPGKIRKGLIAFAIPKGAEIDTFQMGLNSGFATQKGEWQTR